MITILDIEIIKQNKFTILSIVIFVSALSKNIKLLIESPNEYMIWITILILFLLISKICLPFINNKKLFYKSILIVSLSIIYLIIGAMFIRYNAEHIDYEMNKEQKAGTKVRYTFYMTGRMNSPISVIKVIPIGAKGLEKHEINSRYTRDIRDSSIATTMTFVISEENIKLPTRTIVIYRALGVIPMINIRTNELAGM
ncbi:hypothetical protein Amet_0121 [Alkaliphilus metalliredigens QYMF]|uniref:Uncharacterized protein n=1 Tax=Alkaliphilus metalliredigens (strain QYMF) TaxID=293826 RepID=A6TJJ3_ALKMQ|nr:hypothetical protein [Alkaliphilus metalliredigens]ABR46361.1 hypothetical protein Amet_0121 [Alkaliphilus metalliredigens QYMF]